MWVCGGDGDGRRSMTSARSGLNPGLSLPPCIDLSSSKNYIYLRINAQHYAAPGGCGHCNMHEATLRCSYNSSCALVWAEWLIQVPKVMLCCRLRCGGGSKGMVTGKYRPAWSEVSHGSQSSNIGVILQSHHRHRDLHLTSPVLQQTVIIR